MPETHAADIRASELKEGQLRKTSFGEAHVLLAKVNGEIFATGTKCTHYGAELEKGVLTKEGRIVCPWHGACFSAKSGDIEDAPALDSIASYQVTVKDDHIWVSAEIEAVKNGRRKNKTVGACQSTRTVVIIGGGAGAIACAEGLREASFDGQIIVLTKEQYAPYDRTKLSKAPGIGIEKIKLRDPQVLEDLGIQIMFNKTVSRIDKVAKVIHTECDIYRYDDVVIAVGGSPNILKIRGVDGPSVFILRSLEDAKELSSAIGEDKSMRLVILGSSFIGMEIAAAYQPKAKSVTVLARETPFSKVLGKEIGQQMQKLHESNGVKFVIGDNVKELVRDGTTLVGAQLSTQRLDADVFVVAIGVKPATEFLTSDLDLEDDQSLKVNAKMQHLPGIYAVGDIASYPEQTNDDSLTRIEHWNVAMNQGRVAAWNIAGVPTEFRKIPYFWTAHFGKNIRYCGHATSWDDLYIRGSLADYAFEAYFIEKNKVKAVASMGADPIVSHCSELMRLGVMPSGSDLRGGVRPLEIKA